MRSPQLATAALVCLLAAMPTVSTAQACFGFASFRETPFQVSIGAAFNPDVKGLTTSLRGGKKFFGMVKTGITRYDRLDGSSNDVSAGAGYELPMSHARAFGCVTAVLTASTGPVDVENSGIDFRTVGGALGISIGAIALRTAHFQLVPAAVVQLVYANSTVVDHPLQTNFAKTNTYGVFSASAGLVLKRGFTLHPGIAAPFGLRNPNVGLPYALYNAKASLTMDVALSFGHRVPADRR